MKEQKKKFIIIDGNALIHRSFHALPPDMRTKDGRPTNAVYGFATVLLKAIKEFKPSYAAVTFDRKGPTFRHEKYSEYKAHRVKAPDELYEQIPMAKRLAEAFGMPVYEMDGYEADDLIGTITKTTSEAGSIESIIVTGDADAYQLIDESTKVFTMSRGITDSILYDEVAIRAKYGLNVSQLIDYKALRGDPSDNIPGVRGIGEKTATELLNKFGNLEEVYKKIDTDDDADSGISKRIISLLKEHKDEAFLSKELATIKRDVPMDFSIQAAAFNGVLKDSVIDVLTDFEFKSLLARLSEFNADNKSTDIERSQTGDKFERDKKNFKYKIVDNDKSFETFIKLLSKQKYFVFDTETSSLDPLLADLYGISFSWQEGEAYYLRIDKKNDNKKDETGQVSLFGAAKTKELLGRDGWLIKLRDIFEDEKIKKGGHNMKYDTRVMMAHGVVVNNSYFDTMIASYLLKPGSRQHNLDALTLSELGWEKISTSDLLGEKTNKKTFEEIATEHPERLGIYSCEDADFTWRLACKLEQDLSANKLEKLFSEIEMPLVPVLASMENEGIKLDAGSLDALGGELHAKISDLEKKIWEIAGTVFNINSTKQLKEVLFDKLQISTEGITKKKTGLSTAFDELEKMKDKHDIIRPIQEYRELAKLLSTYVESLPKLINPATGRIHTSYNQTVAATGRLSSTDPNLQNIPIKTEQGRKIRKAFVSKEGWRLVSLDYSQIELRLAAHYSKDQVLVDAFKNDEDIHTATAAKINNIAIEDVTKEMRREAKAVNFGILYGQGAHGLSQSADISFADAKLFIEKYFKTFPGIKIYIDKTIEEARRDGFVETLFGRRRYLPDMNSSNQISRRAAERMAVNTPLQGTAADMLKKAMVEIFAEIRDKDDVKMLLQVHDELVFEIRQGSVDKYSKIIKDIMERVVDLDVPVLVDTKSGENWGEME